MPLFEQDDDPNPITLTLALTLTLTLTLPLILTLSPNPMQDDEHYPLTREGRLALGLEDDAELEDWAQARAKRQGRQLGPAKDQSKEGKRAAAPASPPQQLFVPPPPPPGEWVFPLEGDRIDVEAEVGLGLGLGIEIGLG